MCGTRAPAQAGLCASWEETAYDEPAEGPKQAKVVIRKTYRGALDGTGVAEVLTAQGAAGAGYVASERIDATLDGRKSTFGTVVPHSGTAGLAGLSGRPTEAGPCLRGRREPMTIISR